jgi:hypothetical protein
MSKAFLHSLVSELGYTPSYDYDLHIYPNPFSEIKPNEYYLDELKRYINQSIASASSGYSYYTSYLVHALRQIDTDDIIDYIAFEASITNNSLISHGGGVPGHYENFRLYMNIPLKPGKSVKNVKGSDLNRIRLELVDISVHKHLRNIGPADITYIDQTYKKDGSTVIEKRVPHVKREGDKPLPLSEWPNIGGIVDPSVTTVHVGKRTQIYADHPCVLLENNGYIVGSYATAKDILGEARALRIFQTVARIANIPVINLQLSYTIHPKDLNKFKTIPKYTEKYEKRLIRVLFLYIFSMFLQDYSFSLMANGNRRLRATPSKTKSYYDLLKLFNLQIPIRLQNVTPLVGTYAILNELIRNDELVYVYDETSGLLEAAKATVTDTRMIRSFVLHAAEQKRLYGRNYDELRGLAMYEDVALFWSYAGQYFNEKYGEYGIGLYGLRTIHSRVCNLICESGKSRSMFLKYLGNFKVNLFGNPKTIYDVIQLHLSKLIEYSYTDATSALNDGITTVRFGKPLLSFYESSGEIRDGVIDELPNGTYIYPKQFLATTMSKTTTTFTDTMKDSIISGFTCYTFKLKKKGFFYLDALANTRYRSQEEIVIPIWTKFRIIRNEWKYFSTATVHDASYTMYHPMLVITLEQIEESSESYFKDPIVMTQNHIQPTITSAPPVIQAPAGGSLMRRWLSAGVGLVGSVLSAGTGLAGSVLSAGAGLAGSAMIAALELLPDANSGGATVAAAAGAPIVLPPAGGPGAAAGIVAPPPVARVTDIVDAWFAALETRASELDLSDDIQAAQRRVDIIIKNKLAKKFLRFLETRSSSERYSKLFFNTASILDRLWTSGNRETRANLINLLDSFSKWEGPNALPPFLEAACRIDIIIHAGLAAQFSTFLINPSSIPMNRTTIPLFNATSNLLRSLDSTENKQFIVLLRNASNNPAAAAAAGGICHAEVVTTVNTPATAAAGATRAATAAVPPGLLWPAAAAWLGVPRKAAGAGGTSAAGATRASDSAAAAAGGTSAAGEEPVAAEGIAHPPPPNAGVITNVKYIIDSGLAKNFMDFFRGYESTTVEEQYSELFSRTKYELEKLQTTDKQKYAKLLVALLGLGKGVGGARRRRTIRRRKHAARTRRAHTAHTKANANALATAHNGGSKDIVSELYTVSSLYGSDSAQRAVVSCVSSAG